MRKRTATIILFVLLAIVLAYSIIATRANSSLVDEHNSLVDKYNSLRSTCEKLTARCEELYDENQLMKDGLYSETPLLDAAIGLIHSDAKGRKVENVYVAIAPLEAMSDVNTTQVAYALDTYDEIETLVITFVGDGAESYTVRLDNN